MACWMCYWLYWFSIEASITTIISIDRIFVILLPCSVMIQPGISWLSRFCCLCQNARCVVYKAVQVQFLHWTVGILSSHVPSVCPLYECVLILKLFHVLAPVWGWTEASRGIQCIQHFPKSWARIWLPQIARNWREDQQDQMAEEGKPCTLSAIY